MKVGVKNPNDIELSTSSCTRLVAMTTVPVSVTSIFRYGATLAVPNPGNCVWALV